MTMENKKLEIPKKPFADFKWKWASVQCTEGINDPVVLLGILFRMAKLEGKYKYSSKQFGNELIDLSHDLQGTGCLLYTSPSPRDLSTSRMPSSA